MASSWSRPCPNFSPRSEEHTSELQSQSNLVCRLLLEKKKNKTYMPSPSFHVTVNIQRAVVFLPILVDPVLNTVCDLARDVYFLLITRCYCFAVSYSAP